MAKTPKTSSPTRTKPTGLGFKLVGLGAGLFVLTRIINWLPLSLLGTWINGFLYPVALISAIAGIVMLWRSN